MQVKSRHHLRSDAIAAIEDALQAHLGVAIDGETYERVELEDSDWEVVLVDGAPLVVYVDGDPFVTVQGANELQPDRGVVTVDAGAVQFVSDGADVMRPGIVDADDTIEAGDLVVIDEETHGKYLAIGRSRVDGSALLGEEGKVIDTVHHVGDDLFGFRP